MLVVTASGLAQPSASAVPAAPLKKKCKVVVKKVHGKKKHVRVCPTQKPKPVAPAQLAARLSAALDSAQTDAARYAALLRTLGTINLGVYDGKSGKPIAKGLDTNRYDAYLFGGEVRGIAAALGTKKPFSTADVASLLTTVLERKANPVPTQAANELVRGLVQVALARPNKAASLVPLLVRDLGLAGDHPVDLAQAAGADPIALDAVQLELIEAYLLYPIIHRGSQRQSAQLRRPAVRGTAICKVLKYAVNRFNPNSYLDSEDAVHVLTDTAVATLGGQLAVGLAEALKLAATATALEALDLVFTVLAGFHGSFLALSLELRSGPPLAQGTAYGRSGIPGQGNPMHFRAQAVYHEVLSPEDAACFAEMGFEMPEASTVAGMDVAWSEEDVSGKPLDEHGSLQFDLPGVFANGRTNEDGVSMINFTPNDEAVPGIGRLVTDRGAEIPRALWGFKFKNPLGSITQVLFPLLGPQLSWTVQYHKPRGFKVAGMVRDNFFIQFGRPSGRIDVNIHVCGSDPYAKPWEGTDSAVSEGDKLTSEVTWQLVSGAPTFPEDAQYGYTQNWLRGQLVLDGPVPQMQFSPTSGPAGPFYLPVEEDTSCPET